MPVDVASMLTKGSGSRTRLPLRRRPNCRWGTCWSHATAPRSARGRSTQSAQQLVIGLVHVSDSASAMQGQTIISKHTSKSRVQARRTCRCTRFHAAFGKTALRSASVCSTVPPSVRPQRLARRWMCVSTGNAAFLCAQYAHGCFAAVSRLAAATDCSQRDCFRCMACCITAWQG